MNEVLRLVIVEGPLLRLREPLEAEGFSIAASAPRGCNLLTLVGRHRPDAVLLDLDLSEFDSTTPIRRLTERFPDLPAIVLGDSVLPTVITTVFEAGARAYIVKTAELDPLVDAVRLAVEMGYPKPVLDSSGFDVLRPSRTNTQSGTTAPHRSSLRRRSTHTRGDNADPREAHQRRPAYGRAQTMMIRGPVERP